MAHTMQRTREPQCMADLARERIARARAPDGPQREHEEVARLRAEGWVILGGPDHGYVFLPPERD